MPHFTNQGAEIYYRKFGAGPPIVFAHGVGGNHASWFYQIDEFSRDHQTIVFDHRGFGNSSDPENLGRSAFVDDLAKLLDILELEKAVLVAQSMGGGTCAGFSYEFPERVSALVLADTMVGITPPDDIKGFMDELRRTTESLSQRERVLGPKFCRKEPALAILYTEICSFNSVDRKTLSGELKSHTPEELAATGLPIMFIVGEDDALFPPKCIRAVHDRVPGSRYVEIEDAGHSVYFEKPDTFNLALREFLRDTG